MSSSKGSKGHTGVKGRQCSNNNVSLSALSKHDKFLISCLKVEPKQPQQPWQCQSGALELFCLHQVFIAWWRRVDVWQM